MSWFLLPRKPEPEVMADAEEAEVYASAAAQQYLDELDDSLVAQILDVWRTAGSLSGRLIDIGCGPGSIALKIARRAPGLRVLGADRSAAMVRIARSAVEQNGAHKSAGFLQADGNRLPFAAASFDFVLSNSVLHHLVNPGGIFEEMARIVKPGGVILLRDLRRPSRFAFSLHVWWFGRHYSGLMKKLYRASVGAAYTQEELTGLLSRSPLRGSRIFSFGRTHLGFVYNGRAASRTEAP
jgi:trans-aconitate 2-methyltransferase